LSGVRGVRGGRGERHGMTLNKRHTPGVRGRMIHNMIHNKRHGMTLKQETHTRGQEKRNAGAYRRSIGRLGLGHGRRM
jgi:hypothetical protein